MCWNEFTCYIVYVLLSECHVTEDGLGIAMHKESFNPVGACLVRNKEGLDKVELTPLDGF